MMMHSPLTSSSLLLATLLSLYIMTISLFSTSLALPASPTDLISNRQYQHIIKTRSAGQRYCGNNIVNILSLLCDGNYFSPSKRNLNQDSKQNTLNNGIGTFWDDMTPNAEYKTPEVGSNDYFIEPKRAFSLLNGDSENGNNFQRNRRGIVEECCKKACTIRELYSYCD